jgi:hypothetical protein
MLITFLRTNLYLEDPNCSLTHSSHQLRSFIHAIATATAPNSDSFDEWAGIAIGDIIIWLSSLVYALVEKIACQNIVTVQFGMN